MRIASITLPSPLHPPCPVNAPANHEYLLSIPLPQAQKILDPLPHAVCPFAGDHLPQLIFLGEFTVHGGQVLDELATGLDDGGFGG